MRLRECGDVLDGVTVRCSLDREITGLTDDSRRVSPGWLFVAVKGTQSDGHRFLAQAVAAGAGAIVVETGRVSGETLASIGIPVIQVGDSRRALGLLASRFYGDPSRRLKMIGVTGTNGTAVFTNLTQDHLDFHTDMEDYFRAKLRLFTALDSEAHAIVNGDDPHGGRVVEATQAKVWTYAIDRPADLRAEDVQISLNGVRFTARGPGGSVALRSPLVGRHNVYNILAAVGVGLVQGVPLETSAAGVATLKPVPGRFEQVDAGQPFTVVVDYAHTEDALYRLLTTAQTVRTGRIITVFGCGGDRDRGKRPKMGRVAARYSDVVVVTSDNPRTEDPDAIIREILPGVEAGLREAGHGRYQVQADRRAAIAEAIRLARPGDLVLIAGKGHEDYQIIGQEKHPFDDRVVAREAIEALAR